MAGPELPVIYENPRFDAATPTLKPVVDRAVRFGAVLMIEWGTLTLIEDAPRYLKVASVVIAVLILAVHESWPWLRMRNRRLYPALMTVLLLTFVGICGQALWTAPESSLLTGIASLTPAPPTPQAAPVPTPPVHAELNADQIQYRTDLRKFVLSPFSQAWSNAARLAYLSMQNSAPNGQNSPGSHLFRTAMQYAIEPNLDPLFTALSHSEIDTMDVPKIEQATRQAIASYLDFQTFWLDYQQLTNAAFDPALMKQWFAADSATVSALENLKTYPEAGGNIRGVPDEMFISVNHKMDAFLKDK